MTNINNNTTSIPKKQDRASYNTDIIDALHKKYGYSKRHIKRFVIGEVDAPVASKIIEDYIDTTTKYQQILDDLINSKL